MKIKDEQYSSATVVEICYTPPSQEEELDEAYFTEVTKLLKSYDMVLMGDINFLHIARTTMQPNIKC